MWVLGEVACVTGNAGALANCCGGLAQSQESEKLASTSPEILVSLTSRALYAVAKW